MSTALYHPAAWLDRLFADLDGNVQEKTEGFVPAVDVVEQEEAYLLRGELPGISRDSVKIEVKDNRLTISGRKENPWSQRNGRYGHVESGYGSFRRSFSLPRELQTGDISAEMRDGVLTVRIPKAKEALPKKIEIRG